MTEEIEKNSIEELLLDNETKQNSIEELVKTNVEEGNNNISILEVLANDKKVNDKKPEPIKEKSEENEYIPSKKASSIKTRNSIKTNDSMDDDKTYSYKRRITNKENKNEYIKNEKKEILYKMNKIKGDKFLKYDLTYTLDELQTAYYQMVEKRKNDMAVEQYKQILKVLVIIIEFANKSLPFGLDLDGWSEAMAYSLEEEQYDEVLAELYEKYKHVVQMSPELKLAGMLSMSAISFTLAKKLSGGISSGGNSPNLLGNIITMFAGGLSGGGGNTTQKLSTEDFEPSKINTPSVNLNDNMSEDGIDEIFRKMEESKKRKELEKETIKNITINKRNKNKKK